MVISDNLINFGTQIAGIVSLLWTAWQEYRHKQEKKTPLKVNRSSFLNNSSIKKAVISE